MHKLSAESVRLTWSSAAGVLSAGETKTPKWTSTAMWPRAHSTAICTCDTKSR